MPSHHGIERIRDDLTHKQVDGLISKIGNDEMFYLGPIGHVEVRTPRRGHPRHCGHPLPVGFIKMMGRGEHWADLVNTGERAFRKYHHRLREIYESV